MLVHQEMVYRRMACQKQVVVVAAGLALSASQKCYRVLLIVEMDSNRQMAKAEQGFGTETAGEMGSAGY